MFRKRCAGLGMAAWILCAVSDARAQDAEVDPPKKADPGTIQSHHEQPGDPPAARLRGAAPDEIGYDGPPMFGLPPSMQVNTDANGDNIPNDAANEPSIAVDPTNPNVIVIGWRQFDNVASNFRQAGYAYSHDAGRTWTFPGVFTPGVFRSDPVLDADNDGNIYYYSLQGTFEADMFKSSDGGVTWAGPTPAFGGDKAWFIVDKTGSVGEGNIYAAWSTAGNNYFPNQFTRSTDGGATYLNPVEIPPRRPVWGTLTTDLSGDLYIGGIAFDNLDYVVTKSTNAKFAAQTPTFGPTVVVDMGGDLSWSEGPNPGGLLGQVWIAADRSGGPTSGNIYMLASVDPPGNDPLDVKFVRSEDGGQTWSAPLRVNDDAADRDSWQWFGTLSVAPNGRIDVIWNDTRESGQEQISRLYYAFSTDAGQTWSPNRAVSPAFNSHVGWPNQNKIGDYYDMVSDEVGANVAYSATFNGEQDVYFLRLGDFDCNGNGVGDSEDIASGSSPDFNENGIPDECEGLGDLNCDGAFDGADIDPFFLALGDPPAYEAAFPDCDSTNADINGDNAVDGADIDAFFTLLGG